MSKVRQVEELIIGNALSTETTVSDFIASAANKELGVFSVDGTAVAEGKPFKFLQKTASDAVANGFEFSEKIYPDKIERITVVKYAPEVQRKVTLDNLGTPESDMTYVAEIRFYNPMSVQSTENFDIISGYHVTGSNTSDTEEDVYEALAETLNKTLAYRGGHEFTVTASAAGLVIEGKEQIAVPGKDEGRMVQFEVIGKSFDNLSSIGENTRAFTSTVTTAGSKGKGTGKYAVNKEWFTKGFKYDIYRETAYPANFTPPYYASQGETYNVIHIHHFDDRISPGVERQYKTVTILIEGADQAVTNAVLGEIRTAVNNAKVPADLV